MTKEVIVAFAIVAIVMLVLALALEIATQILRRRMQRMLSRDCRVCKKRQKEDDDGTNEQVLKPCPFCGGKAEIVECTVFMDAARRIRCTCCKMWTLPVLVDHPAYTVRSMPDLDESTRHTAEQASQKVAEMWNRRAEQ